MILSKGLTRLGGVLAAAALLLGVGLASAPTTHAQAGVMAIYGVAPSGTAVIQVLVDGSVCKTAAVGMDSASPTGYLFQGNVGTEDGCSVATGSAISFTVDGAAASETLTWSAGGTPVDGGFPVSPGITLTTSGGGTPTTPTPPDTGDAGLLASSSSSPWLALGLGALAVAMLAGARSATGRVR